MPEDVHAGFIPLADCAPLVIARELELDREEGFVLHLHREVSWANIRDKVDVGAFDCAHMLAPMPIAAALGLGRATEPLIVPLALNLNGNAITVSQPLFREMLAANPDAARAGGMAAGRALADVARARRSRGAAPLSFGIVFPFSSHNYDLRYWLAAAGLDPDEDVNLAVIPPPLLTGSLEAGRVDGFCVGEPWSSVAAARDLGVIVATKSELWPGSPEKVLGLREDWAGRRPELTGALVRALVRAARWLDEAGNRRAAARILARPEYVGVPEDILARPLSGELVRGGGLPDLLDAGMVVFYQGNATFPWRSHAIWLMTQMIRWGQVRRPFSLRHLAARVYRPDLYRKAVAGLGVSCPAEDGKPEGAGAAPPGVFFGGEAFDWRAPLSYLSGFAIRARSVDLEAFAETGS